MLWLATELLSSTHDICNGPVRQASFGKPVERCTSLLRAACRPLRDPDASLELSSFRRRSLALPKSQTYASMATPGSLPKPDS